MFKASSALFSLGFRPFFLLGSGFAAIAIVLWIAGLGGHLSGWQPVGGWLAWHQHEMLFGFAGAIIAGFVLTAAQNWTNQPGPSGWPILLLALLWLTARLAWLLNAPLWLLFPLELAFLPLVAVLLGRMLWAVRQQRNYPIMLVLLLLALTNLFSLLGMQQEQFAWQRQASQGALWLIAALMGLIGGRVIPFFTQRGLGLPSAAAALPWLDNLLLVGSLLVALLMASGLGLRPQLWIALLFMVLGAGHLLRLMRWHHPRIWGVPLLWSLHLAYAWLVMALFSMALWHAGWMNSASAAIHMLAIGSLGGLILAMIARVSLGHTGRPLEPVRAMSLAFILLNLAVPLRIWLTLWLPMTGYWLAALCWTLAFALFVWHYAGMLSRPRPDGRPG